RVARAVHGEPDGAVLTPDPVEHVAPADRAFPVDVDHERCSGREGHRADLQAQLAPAEDHDAARAVRGDVASIERAEAGWLSQPFIPEDFPARGELRQGEDGPDEGVAVRVDRDPPGAVGPLRFDVDRPAGVAVRIEPRDERLPSGALDGTGAEVDRAHVVPADPDVAVRARDHAVGGHRRVRVRAAIGAGVDGHADPGKLDAYSSRTGAPRRRTGARTMAVPEAIPRCPHPLWFRPPPRGSPHTVSVAADRLLLAPAAAGRTLWRASSPALRATPRPQPGPPSFPTARPALGRPRAGTRRCGRSPPRGMPLGGPAGTPARSPPPTRWVSVPTGSGRTRAPGSRGRAPPRGTPRAAPRRPPGRSGARRPS